MFYIVLLSVDGRSEKSVEIMTRDYLKDLSDPWLLNVFGVFLTSNEIGCAVWRNTQNSKARYLRNVIKECALHQELSLQTASFIAWLGFPTAQSIPHSIVFSSWISIFNNNIFCIFLVFVCTVFCNREHMLITCMHKHTWGIKLIQTWQCVGGSSWPDF